MTPPPQPLPFLHPVSLLATWFGSGLLPWAPGTWGSLAALPFGALLVWAGGPWALFAAAAVVFAVGIWAGARYAEAKGLHDPGPVVIDEVAGQWLALIPAGLDPWLYLTAFLAFRVFDVAKLWPANWIDRSLAGGFGIMADDLVAGTYAAALCYLVGLAIG